MRLLLTLILGCSPRVARHEYTIHKTEVRDVRTWCVVGAPPSPPVIVGWPDVSGVVPSRSDVEAIATHLAQLELWNRALAACLTPPKEPTK